MYMYICIYTTIYKYIHLSSPTYQYIHELVFVFFVCLVSVVFFVCCGWILSCFTNSQTIETNSPGLKLKQSWICEFTSSWNIGISYLGIWDSRILGLGILGIGDWDLGRLLCMFSGPQTAHAQKGHYWTHSVGKESNHKPQKQQKNTTTTKHNNKTNKTTQCMYLYVVVDICIYLYIVVYIYVHIYI